MKVDARAYHAFPPAGEVIEKLSEARGAFFLSRAQLESEHCNWDGDVDARLNAFHKIGMACDCALMALHAFEAAGASYWFWMSISGPPDVNLHRIAGFNVFIRFGLFQSVFSCLESTIRVLLRKLGPALCGRGTRGFAKIWKAFAKRVTLPRDYEDFVNLLLCSRNTIHNNGYYYPQHRGPVRIAYHNRIYQFDDGRIAECLGWDDIVDHLNETLQLLNDIVRSPEISKIPAILDHTGVFGGFSQTERSLETETTGAEPPSASPLP